MRPPPPGSRSACIHGHPWPENLRLTPQGWAKCGECLRIQNRERYHRNFSPVMPDEVAIARAVRGDRPDRLTWRERDAAVRKLTDRGLTSRQIAEQLGCHQRTVFRARNRAA